MFRSSFLCLSFILMGCLQEAAKPDGDLIHVGNGAVGEKTLVVDSSSSGAKKTSFITHQNLKSLNEALHILDDKFKPSSLFLGWMSFVNSGNNSEPTSFSEVLSPDAENTEHRYARTDGDGKTEWVPVLKSLEFSNEIKPAFTSDGSVVFISPTRELKYYDGKEKVFNLAQDVKNFVLERSGAIFFENSKDEYFVIFKSELPQIFTEEAVVPHLLSTNALVYFSDANEAYVFPFGRNTGLGHELEPQQLYYFNSQTLKFEKLWKKEAEIKIPNINRVASITGNRAYLLTEVSDVPAFVELGPDGVILFDMPRNIDLKRSKLSSFDQDFVIQYSEGKKGRVFHCSRTSSSSEGESQTKLPEKAGAVEEIQKSVSIDCSEFSTKKVGDVLDTELSQNKLYLAVYHPLQKQTRVLVYDFSDADYRKPESMRPENSYFIEGFKTFRSFKKPISFSEKLETPAKTETR